MPKKVLIVEDDGNIAELLHLYLEKEGFETQVAKDGGKGVEYFRSFQPDLVLLDIMLPIMDGWTVLKKIREASKTPVIMLTAKGETEDKVTGLEGGADDYIVKPFEMKELIARIHAVLCGLARSFLNDNTAVTVHLKPLGGCLDQRIGGGADRHDNGIYIQDEFTSLYGNRAAAAALIRRTKLHTDALHPADKAILGIALILGIFIAENFHGIAE